MSFETATQRMAELRALTTGADSASAPSQPRAVAADAAAFADRLELAQGGTGLAGMPASSQASGLPVFAPQGYGPSSVYGNQLSSYPLGGVGSMQPGYGGAGARMLALAQGQLGVKESPPGSNEGPEIAMYRSATAGAAETPGPWCSYFVSWLAAQSGAPVGAGGAGTGYVPTLESWARDNGRYLESGAGAQPGDVVIFDRNGDGLADHTGIVERVDAQGIHTIEGNTSDGVARRDYAPGSSQVRGLVRLG